MQITSFYPVVLTKDSETAIKTFEALGFERRHAKTGINGRVTSVDLKNVDGFRVNVVQTEKVPQDMTIIRINVRDFEEAYEFFKARGFRNAQGDTITDTGSSKATMMISPTGLAVNITEHIRK